MEEEPTMNSRNRATGMLLVMGSAIIYGITPTLMKVTFAYGGNGLLSTFYTSIFSLPMLWLWARLAGISLRVDKATFGRIALLSLGVWPTSLLLYSSYMFIPVGMATTFHFIFPVVTAIYLTVFYHEKFGLINIAALALSVGGIACMSANGLSGGSFIGILLALSSGFTWAFHIVYVKKSGLSSQHPALINFYMALSNTVFAGLACLITDGRIALYSTLPIWVLVIFTAFIHRVTAGAMFQIGIRSTSAFSASIFSTFEPVVSIIVGVLFLHERFTFAQVAGLMLILSSIVCTVFAGKKGQAEESMQG